MILEVQIASIPLSAGGMFMKVIQILGEKNMHPPTHTFSHTLRIHTLHYATFSLDTLCEVLRLKYTISSKKILVYQTKPKQL